MEIEYINGVRIDPDNEHILYFDINMIDIPLPEGECENFIEYFNPALEQYLQHYKNFSQIEVIYNHPFECNMMLINGLWWYEEAHKQLNRYNIPINKATYCTGNYKVFQNYNKWHTKNCPEEPKMNLKVIMQMLWCYAPNVFNDGREQFDFNYCDIDADRPLGCAYNSLNRVARRHRMETYKQLFDRNLLQEGLCSFNEVRSAGIKGELTQKHLDNLPVILDKPEGRTAQEWIYNSINAHQYHPEVSEHNNFYTPILENSLFSLVTETSFGIPDIGTDIIGKENWIEYFDEGFITEKTFRTLANGHPCVWVGAPGLTKVLQRIGFKTFNEYWDESYDKITDPIDRINAVIDLVEQLCKLSQSERKELYENMKPVLKHNQELILNMQELPSLDWTDYHEYLKYNL